jgi:hypothetical protein
MTERELGKALLNLDMGPNASADPRLMARRILDRDRWRVRILTALTAVLWVAAAAGVVALITCYHVIVSPRLQAYHAGRAQLEQDWRDWALAGDIASKGMMMSVLVLLLAAVCTVLLIWYSRRVTLRQINANLVVISEQLRLLTQPPGEPRKSQPEK